MSAYIQKSKTDNWATPVHILKEYAHEFGELFDPCPLNSSFDGLDIEWKDVNFVNPPYSCWGKWVKIGKTSIFLIPSRTDTKAWHEFVMKGEVRFIKGRLKFGDGKSPAPFASAIVIFRKK